MTGWRLIGDVGGTNARFARSADGAILDRRNYAVPGHPTFYDALRHYLAEMGGTEGCASVAIDAAGPADNGRVKLTNAPWTIDARETAELLGGIPTRVVNDLEAAAAGLPYLTDENLTHLGGTRPQGTPRPMLALNVGTGFGAAAAVPSHGGWTVLGCEPGHMALGAVDADELPVIEGFGTVEELLSGRGVRALYARLAARRGYYPEPPRRGSEIFADAAAGADATATEAVHHFSRVLGRIAGDLVLASGAWGGVFLCGSVVQGWKRVADRAAFRAAFEAKGPMTERMRGVYSGIIEMEAISLFGLTHLQMEG